MAYFQLELYHSFEEDALKENGLIFVMRECKLHFWVIKNGGLFKNDQ